MTIIIELITGLILFKVGTHLTTKMLEMMARKDKKVLAGYIELNTSHKKILAPAVTSLENLVFMMTCVDDSIENTITIKKGLK